MNFYTLKAPIIVSLKPQKYSYFYLSKITVCYFTKINMEKPWGDFDINLMIHEKAKDDSQAEPGHNVPHSFNASGSKASGSNSSSSEISCSACTFLNPRNAKRCEVCDALLH